ncbi:monooxygenase [Kaistia sp. 32K]|uniref:LLM class flavin-dependent oxidoreductase n=1 Tax=Kaistia sp. 32K TaxID=2795690 RepID=UPI001915E117|nr:LLM class flavin-dependent oxidoreductase [Kaistia sp. 32K]BCP52239.1 monooxygenase [Kaistia sp. 32K]
MSKKRPLKKLGFLHIVPFDRNDPGKGLEEALQLFEYAEELGLDGGWIRTRHLQYGVSSPAVFLAAASQRTKRIALGTAVIPVGYENPFRLAEDLATADLLSGGRLQAGLSVSPPPKDAFNDRIFGPSWREDDFSYERIAAFLRLARGEPIRSTATQEFEVFSDRVEPHSAGLADRTWYGAGSLRSAGSAGEAGLKLLVSNISTFETTSDFAEAQRNQIQLFRERHPLGDAAVVSQGRVVVPTDGASAEQAEKFAAYVSKRTPRTLAPDENRRIVARDALGSTEEIVRQLEQDVSFQETDEFVFELPFVFNQADYRHILEQLATKIGPALGWKPGS